MLKIEDIGDSYIWKGDFIGESFRSSGNDCFAIQPELKEVDGRMSFVFDKQLILDLNVSVTIESERHPTPNNATTSSNSSKHLVDCMVCKKKIDLPLMRKHVGGHIMKGTITGIDVCGFCGKKTCENILTKTSTRGNKEFFKVQSNC